MGQNKITVNQPNIGVHVLTEFVFCDRAGLCTRDTESDDEKPSPANLNFLPDWDEREIEVAFQERIQRAMISLVGSGIAMGMAYLLETQQVEIWPWVGLVTSMVCLMVFALSCYDAGILFSRLLAARWAVAKEPDLAGPEVQEIDWWELRKAGYLPVKNEAPYIDEELGLIGRPWRVLRSGNRGIPVFCQDGNPSLRAQHWIRIAAYCHLLAVCEGSESPFGIVLNRSTRRGVALLIEPGTARRRFQGSLARARQVINNDDDGEIPPAPKPSLCFGCPHGKPCVAQEPFIANRIPLAIIGTVAVDGRHYHSRCGDRFGEIPPHEKAIRLGLSH